MNLTEALKALLDGKNIRRVEWSEDQYIYLKEGMIFDKSGAFYYLRIGRHDLFKLSNIQTEKEFTEDFSLNAILNRHTNRLDDQYALLECHTNRIVKNNEDIEDLKDNEKDQWSALNNHESKIYDIEKKSELQWEKLINHKIRIEDLEEKIEQQEFRLNADAKMIDVLMYELKEVKEHIGLHIKHKKCSRP